jgi:hypothetical protein
MAAITNTWTELFFANRSSGTALATFTTEASMATGMAELGTTANFINLGVPASFFAANEGIGKVLRVEMRGVYGTTGTAPTFTFGLRWTSATGVLIATTTAITPAVSMTNAMWEAVVDIICLSTGPSTTATARATGTLRMLNSANATGTTITTPFCAGSAFGTPTPASLTTAGFDSTVPLAIVPTCACGTSNGANTVTLTDIKALCLNTN